MGNTHIAQFLDDQYVRAFVEISRPTPNTSGNKPRLCAYGAHIDVNGTTSSMWGIGFVRSDDELRAIVVRRILLRFPKAVEIKIITNGLKVMLGHVSRSVNGLKTDGKTPIAGFKFLKPIQEELDRGRWKLEKPLERFFKVERSKAKELAEITILNSPHSTPANQTAIALNLAKFGIVADDSNPDIHGLLNQQTEDD